MKIARAAVLLALLGNAAIAAVDNCPAGGQPVQWIADYCMAKGQTDDLEAVMACIEQAGQIQFRSNCTAKLHFKRLLCEVTLSGGSAYKSVEQCIKDPGFVGPTVKNNGSGS